MKKETNVGRSRSWSRSWSRSRFFQAGVGVGVGVTEIWSTPQPWYEVSSTRHGAVPDTFLPCTTNAPRGEEGALVTTRRPGRVSSAGRSAGRHRLTGDGVVTDHADWVSFDHLRRPQTIELIATPGRRTAASAELRLSTDGTP